MRNPTLALAVLVAGLIGQSPASASDGGISGGGDRPYGSDSFVYDWRETDTIAEAGAITARKSACKFFRLHDVTLGRVFKGDARSGTKLKVVTSVNDDLRPQLSILALEPLPPADQMDVLGCTFGAQVWLANVMTSGSAATRAAVRDYLYEPSDAAHLAWAARELFSTDTYLQRAALLEIEFQGASRTDSSLVPLLQAAVASASMDPRNKAHALLLLAAADDPQVDAYLATVALDRAAHHAIRDGAVGAIAIRKGGLEVLRRWMLGGGGADAVLAELARREYCWHSADCAP